MIYIFFRQTSHNSINNLRPSWFNYEKCFKNLLDILDERCKLTVIFDGNLDSHFTNKYKLKYDFNIVQINAGGDFESNILTFKHIKSLNYIKDDDIVMIQENDYLFINGWVDCVLDLYNRLINKDNVYISLYDHNDKFIFTQNVDNEWGMYKSLVSKIIVTNTRHWRTVPNTCASFLMSKKLFNEDFDVHINGDADNTRFNYLTCNKNRIVLSPIPSLSTHLQNLFIAPIIDWNEINNNIQFLN